MKAVIVNCFDTYEDRVNLVHEFLNAKGYDVTVIQSDFRHFKKVHRIDKKENFVFVKSNPYYKNLSITRLTSHYRFSNDAFKVVESISPDLLYVFIPPNSLTKFAARYKKMNNNVKLIFDLIDLWPETMPIGKAKRFPPFTFWGGMRNKGLKFADLLITECNLYQEVLGDVIKDINTETIHLAKRNIDVTSNPELSKDKIDLAYLGSINNIIDIPTIKKIIQVLNEIKPVTLHIIGDGESKQELIEEVKSTGAVIDYHGKIYDAQVKQDIFDRCHFGLNIMKENVCVGLTMKSIDYFQHGLPILNNIPADTADIVEKNGIGINVFKNKDLRKTLGDIINLKEDSMLRMRNNTLNTFTKQFSIEAYFQRVEAVYKEHIKK